METRKRFTAGRKKNGLLLSISKNSKLQMIDSWGAGGGKLTNANCDYQTTKWEISKTTNYK